jgi:hydroxylaminobenzene mutase
MLASAHAACRAALSSLGLALELGGNMSSETSGQWLILLGLALFLLGLLTGLASAGFANPRMGLAAHIEGVMNGMFLAVLGLVWPRAALGATAARVACWLVVYAAFANWLATTLSGVWGAGSPMMPIAGLGMTGSALQEHFIKFLLITLAIAMVAGVAMVIWGLWRARRKFAG